MGTHFSVEVLDAAGLYAQRETGSLDLSTSDPWLVFPDGPGIELRESDRGHLVRRIARSSGPRGLPVQLRAHLETPGGGALDAALALPELEIRP
jgi:hypothetical protein